MVSGPALPTSPSAFLAEPVSSWSARGLSCGMRGPARDPPSVHSPKPSLQGALTTAKGSILHPCGAAVGFPGQKVIFLLLALSLTSTFLLVLQVKPLPCEFPSRFLGDLEG